MEYHDIDAVGPIRVERCTTATFPLTGCLSGRYVFDTDTAKMYYGTGSEWVEVVGTENEQTLTNKTLIQPVVDDFTSATHDHSDDAKGGTLAHISETEAHGATGSVVGTTNAQTLTNKTLIQPVVDDFTSATHDHSDDANGGLLTLATTGANGLLKQLSNDSGQYMNGQGNWATVDLSSGVAAGTIITWASETPPTNYLECDGGSLLVENYPELFAAIGYDYGGADASFNIPDYRGYFLRGWDHGATIDPDRATRTNRGDGTGGDNIGTKQLDELKSHTHSLPYTFYLAGVPVARFDHGGPSLGPSAVSITSTGGNETRPKNIYVMYCIKYT